MSTPARTIRPDASYPEIVDAMLTNEVSGLVVVDDAGALLGIVTEADLISKEAYGFRRRRPLALIGEFLHDRDPQWVRKASARTARELMTGVPDTASPDDTLAYVARRMIEGRHKRMPVLSDGKVVGVVSRHDLLKPFLREDPDLQREVDELLANPLRVPENQVQAFVNGGVVTLTGDVSFAADAALIGHVVGQIPGVVGLDNKLRSPEHSSLR